MTMWMPPLPDVEQLIYQRCRTFVADNQRAAVEELMRDYALAAVEAYKASLKPVAWFQPHNIEETDEKVPVIGWRYESESYTMPLYRLDDSQRDDSQKDDQP